MRTFDTRIAISDYTLAALADGLTIGFVPTMGALHEGHLQLVREAKKENALAVVSIFVNPIQFNNPADLERYPRNTEKDLALLREAGCDAVFLPSVEEMYPDEVEETYDFGTIEQVMEGAFRPGHFRGVAVVVNRLFSLVHPTRAYFGEKDFQQLRIIQELSRQYHPELEIVPVPIVREADGLAMSSRNMRLTPEFRAVAPFIYQILREARNMAQHATAEEITTFVHQQFNQHPTLKLEYFTIAHEDDLQPAEGKMLGASRGFIAVHAGDIRLIDNIQLI